MSFEPCCLLSLFSNRSKRPLDSTLAIPGDWFSILSSSVRRPLILTGETSLGNTTLWSFANFATRSSSYLTFFYCYCLYMFSYSGPSRPWPLASLWYLVGDLSWRITLSSWLLSNLSYFSVSSVNGFVPWTLWYALSLIILSSSFFSFTFFSLSFSRSHSCSLASTSIFLAFRTLSPCKSVWLFLAFNTSFCSANS